MANTKNSNNQNETPKPRDGGVDALMKLINEQQKKIDALSAIVEASASKADQASALVSEKAEALNVIKSSEMVVIENLGGFFKDSHVIIHPKEKSRIAKDYGEYLKAEYNGGIHGEWFRTYPDDPKYGVVKLNPKATEHIKNQQIQSRASALGLTPAKYKEAQKVYQKLEDAK